MSPTARFAEVVVLAPLHRRPQKTHSDQGPTILIDFSPASQTFTYGIPPNRRGLYAPGQVVWVPFGRSQRQGVILRLVDSAPSDIQIKPLAEPVTLQPALTPAQIELAHWLATTYLAPLSECVKLILPPGFGAQAQVIVEHTPGAPAHISELTPAQQALLLHLNQYGAIPLSELRKLDRRLAADDVMGVLLKEGLIRLRDRIKGASIPKPKKERRLRLVIAPDAIESTLMQTGRRSKQADLLQWLADQPQGQTETTAARRAVNCSPAIIRQLQQRGWLNEHEDRLQLLLHDADLVAAVLQLRGTQNYLLILQALARLGPQPVALTRLREQVSVKLPVVKRLAELGLIEMTEIEVWRDPLAGHVVYPDTPPRLTQDQQQAWDIIKQGLAKWLGPTPAPEDVQPPVYLLHGVTGSGKTELYLRALQWALASQRQGIVLVPEISLTPQTVRRFMARFPGRVAVLHSKLSAGERYDTWRRARQGDYDIIVGSRSALFTPFPRVGVIVVDEEHDAAYKQIRTPRYHARDAAMALARLSGAVTLLGSATPSLESTFQARRRHIIPLSLPRRVRGHRQAETAATDLPEMLDLPEVTVVDMRAELRSGNRSMFSRALRQALQHVLDQQQQAILFLNRRGSATFVLCRDCGYVVHCPRCAIPLTFHGFANVLICHHCNHRQPMPRECPKCHSRRLKEFGAGTQRLIDALRAEFPAARPLRWDRDTTGGKTSHEEILQDFIDHKADVLVGTQMIAKGLDLPLVTLVGVLSADVGLFLPDFRASERAFQVLTQVAGRAGRSALGGRVIFQTYQPQHYAIVAASHHDYDAFYQQEMRFRQENGYPPYRRLTRMLYLDTDRNRCLVETGRVKTLLAQRARELGLDDFSMIGPAPAFFSKERGKFRWHLIFRCQNPAPLLAGIPLLPNWRIDVDPVDTL